MNVFRSKDPSSFPWLSEEIRVNLVEHNFNIIYNTRGINQHKKLIYILFQKRIRLTDFHQQSRLGRFLRFSDFLPSFLAWADCKKLFDMIPHSNVANVWSSREYGQAFGKKVWINGKWKWWQEDSHCMVNSHCEYTETKFPLHCYLLWPSFLYGIEIKAGVWYEKQERPY